MLVHDVNFLTPLFSGGGDGDVLSDGYGWLISILQFLCWMLRLSWWAGAPVLLPLVPGDDLLGGDEGGESSGLFMFLSSFFSRSIRKPHVFSTHHNLLIG